MSAALSISERTDAGLEIRLRPRGAARLVAAAFLLVWLCGWTVGETVVAALLIRGAGAWLSGQPPVPGHASLGPAPTLAMGVFLLAWLFFWTLGGLFALRELVRLVWAEDRLVAGPSELLLESRLGPFRSRRRFAADQVCAIRVARRGMVLVADTTSRTVELSRLGTAEEREKAGELLGQELHLGSAGGDPDRVELPAGWQETLTPEGTAVLVPDLKTRARQAFAVGFAAFVASVVALLLTAGATRSLRLLPPAIVTAALSAGLIAGTVWLARGRMEWRLGSGRIVLQRRYGGSVRELFEATRLELTISSDSDGDQWFELEGVAPTAEAPAAETGAWATAVAERRHRRRIHHVMSDGTNPRQLGQWLSRRADLPFADLTRSSTAQAKLAELRGRLAASGPLGRLASRLIERADQPDERK